MGLTSSAGSTCSRRNRRLCGKVKEESRFFLVLLPAESNGARLCHENKAVRHITAPASSAQAPGTRWLPWCPKFQTVELQQRRRRDSRRIDVFFFERKNINISFFFLLKEKKIEK